MKIRRLWLVGAVMVVAVALGASLIIPAWASSSREGNSPPSSAYGAMHAACGAGDVQGMADAMRSLTPDDWQAMGEQMQDGHHGAMGTGMTGMSGMMGGLSGQSMMGGWSGRGMMAW